MLLQKLITFILNTFLLKTEKMTFRNKSHVLDRLFHDASHLLHGWHFLIIVLVITGQSASKLLLNEVH